MAVIPTIDPTGNRLSTEVGAVRQSPEVAAMPGAMLAELAGGVREIGQQLLKVQMDSESLKASNQLQAKKQDIITRAEQDPDSSEENRQKYFDEFSSAKEDAAKNISLPFYKDRWSAENESNLMIGKQQVSNSFYKKKIAEYDANFKMSIDGFTRDYVNAPMGSPEAEKALIEVDKTLNDYAVNTKMGTNELALAKSQTMALMNKEKINTDAKRNPDKFTADVASGKYGNKDSKEVADGLDVAARETFIRERLDKYKMQDNETELSTRAMQNIDISRDLEEGMYNKTISRSYYKTMSSNYKSKIGPTAKTDSKSYADVISTLQDESLTTDKKLEKIVGANTDGKVSRTDMMKLMELHIIPQKDGFASLTDLSPNAELQDNNLKILMQKEKEDAKQKEMNKGWGAGIESIKNWAGDNIQKFSDAVLHFHNNLSDTKTPSDFTKQAQDTIKAKNIESKPDIKSLPAQGRIFMDKATGVKARVFPDGHIEVMK